MKDIMTPNRLRQIAQFAACNCQCSEPNMEKARQYLRAVLCALTHEKEDGIHYLGMVTLIAEREKNEDLYTQADAAIQHKQAEIEILNDGRGMN